MLRCECHHFLASCQSASTVLCLQASVLGFCGCFGCLLCQELNSAQAFEEEAWRAAAEVPHPAPPPVVVIVPGQQQMGGFPGTSQVAAPRVGPPAPPPQLPLVIVSALAPGPAPPPPQVVVRGRSSPASLAAASQGLSASSLQELSAPRPPAFTDISVSLCLPSPVFTVHVCCIPSRLPCAAHMSIPS